MSLYLIVAADFVTTGGMDRANHALASYLAGRGDEVHLVAHRAESDLLTHPNVSLHRVPKPANSYLLGEPLLDRVGRHWAKRLAGRAGRVIVNGGNCQWGDVNWVHYVHAAYDPHVSGSIFRRVKAKLSHNLFLRHERRTLRRARLVIANSQRTKCDVVQRLSVPADRINVIYYGTDPDDFRPLNADERGAVRRDLGWDRTRLKVAFVGALGDRRKGFDTVFEAWKILCRDPAWPADLAVIGRGAELPAWQQRAHAAGLAARIQFLGFRADVSPLLGGCDALVAPTRYEAYGLGVHEALCCGLPAFVTATAGVAERYPEDLAELLLPNPVDPTDLAQRFRRWHADRMRIAEKVARLSQRLRTGTWDIASARIAAEIDGLPEPAAGNDIDLYSLNSADCALS